ISRVNFLFVGIFFPAFALPYWFLEKRLIRRAIMDLLKQERPDKGQLGTHRIVLSRDGVFERTAVGEARTSWAGIDRVEENEGYIFIYTSPAAAHIIPKRVFRTGLCGRRPETYR